MFDHDGIERDLLDLVPAGKREKAASLLSRLRASDQATASGAPASALEAADPPLAEGPHRAEGEEGEDQAWEGDLRDDIIVIARSIVDVKKQILDLKLPESSRDRIDEANSELDEVVRATETATHQILEANEGITATLEALKEADCAPLHREAIQSIEAECTNILMASSFQDITSQRIKKVVAALFFVEYKINEIASNIGIEGGRLRPEGPGPRQDDPDRHLMQGPASPDSKTIDQDSIDSLFD